MYNNENVMPTHSGFGIDLSKPPHEQSMAININDIIWALSHQCRFAGHTKQFYSVAEHSVRVSWACSPKFALEGLLHDATEAYLQDIIRPLRVQLDSHGYLDLEREWAYHIGRLFGVEDMSVLSPQVKNADLVLLATECRDLIRPPRGVHVTLDVDPLQKTIVPWDSAKARAMFRKRFGFLTGRSKSP